MGGRATRLTTPLVWGSIFCRGDRCRPWGTISTQYYDYTSATFLGVAGETEEAGLSWLSVCGRGSTGGYFYIKYKRFERRGELTFFQDVDKVVSWRALSTRQGFVRRQLRYAKVVCRLVYYTVVHPGRAKRSIRLWCHHPRHLAVAAYSKSPQRPRLARGGKE